MVEEGGEDRSPGGAHGAAQAALGRGERRINATGSTVIRSAAFVAVDSASPQLPKAKAAAKPMSPIQKMFQRSARENRVVAL